MSDIDRACVNMSVIDRVSVNMAVIDRVSVNMSVIDRVRVYMSVIDRVCVFCNHDMQSSMRELHSRPHSFVVLHGITILQKLADL